MRSELPASPTLPATLLRRKAVVYVRQSTQSQVVTSLESQRRQYDLVETARAYGFHDVEVIDDDLGVTASGAAARPGFDKLVTGLCSGAVGAVFCLEVSRLARNGRDWHHMLELCGLAEARVIDHDGVYDPRHPNDRLLLGMKGSISEFELGVLRMRMLEAARAKARRGELRHTPPIGYLWDHQVGVILDPDLRVQEVIRLTFRKFRELGSARQTLLWLAQEQVHFPRPSDSVTLTSFEWRAVRYTQVIKLLKNPFYAGVYAYGKTSNKIEAHNGRGRVARKRQKPIEEWDVFLKDHHEGYISWEDYECNQSQLARNAFGQKGGVKSGRGGDALLAGLVCCGRCGRRVRVAYRGGQSTPVYRCQSSNLQFGAVRCMAFGGVGPDRLVAQAVLEAVSPLAVEAAITTVAQMTKAQEDRRAMVELELQQARYEASLAERRYAACDPENRLIAAQLERRWEEALQRVRDLEHRLDEVIAEPDCQPDSACLEGLVRDLELAWTAPQTTMRIRQRLLRTLIEDIVADVDDETGEVVLVIRWKGGRHTELRSPRPGSTTRMRTSAEALAVIREMTGSWTDEAIAASLNRMGMRTALGKTWTAARVGSIRTANNIPGVRSAGKKTPYRTMTQAARMLGVTNHVIRRLIRDEILPAKQVVPGAPYQIRADDLDLDTVRQAIRGAKAPCRDDSPNQMSMFSDT